MVSGDRNDDGSETRLLSSSVLRLQPNHHEEDTMTHNNEDCRLSSLSLEPTVPDESLLSDDDEHRRRPTNDDGGRLQRFVSIDILRGLAIVMMLFVHIVSDTLDIDYYLSHINTGSLLQLVALVVIPFWGGMAGLFLMVSAMGNMVGMRLRLHAHYHQQHRMMYYTPGTAA